MRLEPSLWASRMALSLQSHVCLAALPISAQCMPFLLFQGDTQGVTRGFSVDRVGNKETRRVFLPELSFFAEPLIASTDNHLSISVSLMAPSLPIYQGWAAKSAPCVEMSRINRKLSQDFWMDGETIRALYSYRLFWKSLLRLQLPQCVRACK